MFYAEVKSCNNAISFPFANIEKFQWVYANAQEKAGGWYYFFLHNLVTNEWYQVPSKVITSLFRDGIKSVKWLAIQQYKHKGLTDYVD